MNRTPPDKSPGRVHHRHTSRLSPDMIPEYFFASFPSSPPPPKLERTHPCKISFCRKCLGTLDVSLRVNFACQKHADEKWFVALCFPYILFPEGMIGEWFQG